MDDLVITAPTGEGPGTPDVLPGGALNPTTTPVSAAQGTGDRSALTFDDGPNGADTTALLDFLADKDLHATFCVIGQNIQAPGGADILKRIVADGHTLCNHGTSYEPLDGTQAEVEADLADNLTIIRTALGNPSAQVPFFRAANGVWTTANQNAAVALGMQPLAVINTISDWETQDEATLTANLRTAMVSGRWCSCTTAVATARPPSRLRRPSSRSASTPAGRSRCLRSRSRRASRRAPR